MSVLVDSSVWIDYFAGQGEADALEYLIEENLVVINDLILAELLPALLLQKQASVVALLRAVRRHPMKIDWEDIIQLQALCLRNGINGVGIPDLIIAQNAIQGGLSLMSRDKHFILISKNTSLSLY
ncbi:MAG: PIN domain-containing protein [Candidatus Hydrogenedentes bacterium]|jgi:predicted nucleic acid-binding protein|nr:PIN domain-containing protein [Candidatus Hydrogenedentota bacterium]